MTQTRSWSSSSRSNTVNGKTTHEGWSKQNSGEYNHETGQGSFKGAADDWSGNFNHHTQQGWMDGNSQGWNGAMSGNSGGPTQYRPVTTWENPWSGPWNGQPGKNGQKPDIGVEDDADATCEDVLAHAEKMKAMLKEMGATGCEQMQAVLEDLANSINSIEYLEEDITKTTPMPQEMPEEEMPVEVPMETTHMPRVETTHKPQEVPVETTTPMPEEMPEGEGLGRSFGARLGSSYHPNLQDYLGRSHKLGDGQYAPKNARGNWKFWEWFDSSEEGEPEEESDSNDFWDWIGDGVDHVFDWDSNDSEETPQGPNHHPQRRIDGFEARRLEALDNLLASRRLEKRSAF